MRNNNVSTERSRLKAVLLGVVLLVTLVAAIAIGVVIG